MNWDLQAIKHLLITRKEDYLNASALFLYLFLIITALLIGKSVSTALFISQYGALKLPYAIIGQTLLITLLIALYLRLARHFQPSALISISLLFFAANALLLWGSLHFKLSGIAIVAYLWSGLFGVIAPMQVWILGNYIFTTREARRYFGFIGSGGLLGFICGGYLSKTFASQLGAENLLPGMVVCCCLAAVLVQFVWQQNSKRIAELQADTKPAPVSLRQSARLIKDSKYLLLITALVTIASLATKIVDVQFSAITEKFIQDKDEMTAFFGSVYTYLGWGAFLLQLLLGGRMLDKLGIGITILVLPLSLLVSSLAALFFAALWTAVLLRFSDQVFKHSIDKSSTELLYLPIPTDIKFQVKSFIDTVVLRAGDGLAGLILLLFTNVIPFINRSRPGWISLLNLPVILLLLYVALQIRKEYLNALRPEAKNKGLDPKKVSQYISEPVTVKKLNVYLASQKTEDILYALEILSRGDRKEELLLPHLQRLIHHPSATIRLKALQMLSSLSREHVVPDAEALLSDPDIVIRAAAARYVYTHCQTDLLTRIESLPDYPDHVIQGGILLNLLQQEKPDNLSVAKIFLDRMVENKAPEETANRVEAARVLGLIPLPVDWHEYLIELLQDKSPEVINQALESAGNSQHPAFLPYVLEALRDRRTQVTARATLVQYGPHILETLKDYLSAAQVSIDIRRQIPRVLARIGGQEAVHILLDCLHESEGHLRYKILKALNQLRSSDAQLVFGEVRILQQLLAEMEQYYRQVQILLAVNPAAVPLSEAKARRQDLLTVSLLEQQEKTTERIFRLLGLLYPPQDIHHAYYGLRSQRSQVRANTVEFLDNLLNPSLRKYLLPIIDSKVTLGQRVRKGRDFWKWKAMTREEALAELINTENRWLCACAIQTAGQARLTKLSKAIQEIAQTADPLLQETAQTAIHQWASHSNVFQMAYRPFSEVE